MPTLRTVRRVILTLAALLLLAVGFGWAFGWDAPPECPSVAGLELRGRILTPDQYRQVIATHPRPYIYNVPAPVGGGAAMILGIEHTKDPADPQVAEIQRRWAAFRPDVALVEGRMGFLPPLVADPVREFGESGATARLARQHGVELYTWEPAIAEEVAAATKRHDKHRAALFFVLRPYFGAVRHGQPADPDAFVEPYRRKRTRWPGLEGTLPDMASIDAAWRQDFAGLPDWRDISDAYGLPGYLNEIATDVGVARDEHLVRTIAHLVRAGRRVFATMGSAHAVKIEAAVRQTIAARSARAR